MSSEGTQTAKETQVNGNEAIFIPTPQPLYKAYQAECDDTPNHLEQPNKWVHKVTIEYDPAQPVGKRLNVDLDPFVISQKGGEQIRWECRSKDTSKEKPFVVDFCKDGCPFEYTQFNQDYPHSGLVRRDVFPDPTRIYHYVIKVDDDVLDPGGGVKP